MTSSAYVAPALQTVVPDPEVELSRLDLIFYGVDHSGPSYEARVFVNNGEADPTTERSLERGYVGSFTVFGHGGCYGDVGHCDIHDRTTDEFDRRPQHPLTPWTKTVIIDPSAHTLLSGEDVTITVVAVAVETGGESPAALPVRFERVRLATYAA